ncbi:unnamed protein product, partial [Brassica napus]
SIGTSSKQRDPLAREVIGRSHAQVSSGVFGVPSISFLVSVEVLERDPVPVCFRWIFHLDLRRNRAAG